MRLRKSMSKSKSTKEMLDQAYDQMSDDRKAIKDSFDLFSGQMANLNDYALNGANINKCLELLTKQTSQLLELAKLKATLKIEDMKLDSDNVYDMIGSDVTKLERRGNGSK